jgi:hypothetical protein
MTPTVVRGSFIAFHLVLGIGLLALSVQTLLHALAPANLDTHKHIAGIAAIEGVGALLFLFPRTLRAGAVLLMITVGGAFLIHGIRGEWRADLAIYSAGIWFVFGHGSGWSQPPTGSNVAA